jgi:hypothetical protein
VEEEEEEERIRTWEYQRHMLRLCNKNAVRLVKISRDNMPAGTRSSGLPKKKRSDNHWLKQVELPVTRRRRRRRRRGRIGRRRGRKKRKRRRIENKNKEIGQYESTREV